MKMNTEVLFIVGVILQACAAQSQGKVPFITKCTPTDSQCITNSARAALPVFAAGIPELGVETLDPMTFDYLDASAPNLKLIMHDAIFSGLTNCNIKLAERDVEKSTLHISTECTVDLEGKYEIDGNILFAPIQGSGNAHYRLKGLALEFYTDLTVTTGQDGQEHLHSNDIQYTYTINEVPEIQLDNLFNGNTDLARAVEELLKTNSKEIMMEMGTPIFDPIIKRVYKSVQAFYDNVPMADLVIV